MCIEIHFVPVVLLSDQYGWKGSCKKNDFLNDNVFPIDKTLFTNFERTKGILRSKVRLTLFVFFFYTDQNSRSPVKGESTHWFNQLAIRSLGVGKGLSENHIHDSWELQKKERRINYSRKISQIIPSQFSVVQVKWLLTCSHLRWPGQVWCRGQGRFS